MGQMSLPDMFRKLLETKARGPALGRTVCTADGPCPVKGFRALWNERGPPAAPQVVCNNGDEERVSCGRRANEVRVSSGACRCDYESVVGGLQAQEFGDLRSSLTMFGCRRSSTLAGSRSWAPLLSMKTP